VPMNTHEHFMQRCNELALLGAGSTAPNPMVGSVIVHEGKIIGEGWHRKNGGPHAEVRAVASVQDKSLLSAATIYVNLEPCAHHAKTPPCADMIVKHQIPTVVIGCVDSFSEVSGKGIKKLRAANCDVTVGVLEAECRHVNRRFFTFHEQQRPYVILKWAQTSDGFIDVARDDEHPVGVNWITGPAVKKLVHQWRREEQSILVGRATAQNDNPSLTVREVDGENPTRLVIDRNWVLEPTLALFNGDAPTIRYFSKSQRPPANLNAGAQNINIPLDFERSIIPQILTHLHALQIQSVIVEGGSKTLQSFVDSKLWDEARVFVGDKTFGRGVEAPRLNSVVPTPTKIGSDQLFSYFRTP
jgi:diaminohydroxyphosphoribosylaminopyrimidine deaminase/5-amino-6-(5-phosphoribosylamino)uracil reductase